MDPLIDGSFVNLAEDGRHERTEDQDRRRHCVRDFHHDETVMENELLKSIYRVAAIQLTRIIHALPLQRPCSRDFPY